MQEKLVRCADAMGMSSSSSSSWEEVASLISSATVECTFLGGVRLPFLSGADFEDFPLLLDLVNSD